MSKHKKINSDTAHRWAHQIGDYSEVKGGRLFFSGDTIYSYGNHFPIARHVKREDELSDADRCVLFTTRTYSVTTRGHCYEVARAIPPHLTVFHVDNVRAGENAEHYPEDAAKQHQHNLDAYRERITEMANLIKSARSRKDSYIERLDNFLKEHNGYIDFFQLDAQHIERHDNLIAQLVKDAEEARKREIEREKADQERREIENFAIIELWKQGKQTYPPIGIQKVYLRKYPFHPDQEAQLETSKGALIPLEHARKAFEVVQKCRERQKGFSTNGRTLRVGNYSIESIDAQGNVRAGCHYIDYETCLEFARKEGWLIEPKEESLQEAAERLAKEGKTEEPLYVTEGDHPGEHDVVQDAINEAALHGET